MLYSHRPRSVTFAALGGFFLGGWNLWRAILLLQRRPFLNALEVSIDPLWRAAMALLWAVVFVSTAVALWQRHSRLRWLLPAGLALYPLYHLSLLWIFAQSPLAWQGWGATLFLYVLAILAAIWALYRPAARPYWRRPSRREHTNHEEGERVT